ncbi:MAG: MFS transporter [Spirochaetes bacterium]|nr:MFS transporter [Spirochaetota bacterium]
MTGKNTKSAKPKSFFLTALPFYILAHGAHHLLTALPMPLLPYIRTEFSLDYTQASFVTSAFALANGAAQLPAGWLADRIGPTILITVGILGVAIAGLLVGLSQSFIMLIAFIILMGLLAGGYHPAATPLISESVEPNQRGRALGIHLIGGNSSFFIAPVIAGMVAGTWGWRGSFLWLAGPTAVFGILFYFYLRKKHSKSHIEERQKKAEAEKPPAPGNIRRLSAFLTMTVLGGGAVMSVMAFLTLYIVDDLGASEEVAASLLSIIFFSGLWAGPVGGYLSDKIGSVPIIIVSSLIGGIIIYILQFPALGIAFYIVLFLMGLNMALRMPVAEAFIMGETISKYRSTLFGIYYFTMHYTGAIFAPFMGGFIEKWGFHTCFSVAGIAVIVITSVCSLFMRGSKA